MAHLTYRNRVQCSALSAWDYHSRAGCLERLAPPWLRQSVLERTGSPRDAGQVRLRIGKYGLGLNCTLRYSDYLVGAQFSAQQISGPFKEWTLQHTFTQDGPDATVIDSNLCFELPGGPLGRLLSERVLAPQLDCVFRYRSQVTKNDIVQISHLPSPALRILVSGATGLLGSALVQFLACAGHNVSSIGRHLANMKSGLLYSSFTYPNNSEPTFVGGQAFDVLIHLAGEPIAKFPFNAAHKKRVLESRVETTRLLSEAVAKMPVKPKALICASAVGWYGDQGEQELTETFGAGSGFLAHTCKMWEEAAEPARVAGIRVCHMRFGIILSSKGGALASMLTPFKLGLGATLGHGKQWFSWVDLDDAIYAIYKAVTDSRLRGAVNVVSPRPVRQKEFAATLATILKRPLLFTAPSQLLRLAFGDFADQGLLASANVFPKVLNDSGFNFAYPSLDQSLRHQLGL